MALHTFYHTLHCSVTLHKTLSSSSHKLRQQCNNTRALTHNQLKFTAPRLVADSQQTQSLSRHVHYRRSEYTVCGISTSGNWNTYTSLCKARKLELTQLTFCAARIGKQLWRPAGTRCRLLLSAVTWYSCYARCHKQRQKKEFTKTHHMVCNRSACKSPYYYTQFAPPEGG